MIFLFTCINSSAADLLNAMLNATRLRHLHSRKKPAGLPVPIPGGFASCPPDISLWSQAAGESAWTLADVDANTEARTDLRRISSWSAITDSRSRPTGCRSPKACCPRLWTELRAATVCRDLLSSGTGPEGRRLLWDTEAGECVCVGLVDSINYQQETHLRSQTYERGWRSSTVSSAALGSFDRRNSALENSCTPGFQYRRHGSYQVAGGTMAWTLASPPSTGTRKRMSCSGTGAAMASVLYL